MTDHGTAVASRFQSEFSALALVMVLGLSACGPVPGAGEATPSAREVTAFFERRWQTRLPCNDCAAVEVTLVLHQDFDRRVYRLVEAYVAASGGEAEVFERRGAWTVRPDGGDRGAVVYVLDPDDILLARRLRLRADGGLEPADVPGEARWRLYPVGAD